MKYIPSAIAVVATVYLSLGIIYAVVIKLAMPSMNYLGAAYVTMAWPYVLHCADPEPDCDGLPPVPLAGYLFDLPGTTPVSLLQLEAGE